MFSCTHLFVILAIVICVDGVPGGRIVGGQVADFREVPYQVSLEAFNRHFCGGTIISEEWIVTAAHCLMYIWPSMITVRIGASQRGVGGITAGVKASHEHPNFSRSTIDNDIALLKLDKPIPKTISYQIASLPQEGEDDPEGTVLRVSGYGATQNYKESEKYLRFVDVIKTSQEKCAGAYGRMFTVTPKMLCAGYWTGQKDACAGDSGGPLVKGTELVGVVSVGYGCARPGYPGIYARVAAVRSWIRETSGI